ncbi:MAG: purine-binding chemotaxis protein CheW [Veillonellaceae bacterium]|jgi:purine-binding chemotaxis protein CheW|nr:purine-binding chemotaxis protein CheW [Veillonellaceae bacterium]
MGEEQLVVFRLGNEEYGVSISQVREIIQYRTATRLPNTPDFMEGIISLRSKVIPALDLAKKFGLSMNVGMTGTLL